MDLLAGLAAADVLQDALDHRVLLELAGVADVLEGVRAPAARLLVDAAPLRVVAVAELRVEPQETFRGGVLDEAPQARAEHLGAAALVDARLADGLADDGLDLLVGRLADRLHVVEGVGALGGIRGDLLADRHLGGLVLDEGLAQVGLGVERQVHEDGRRLGPGLAGGELEVVVGVGEPRHPDRDAAVVGGRGLGGGGEGHVAGHVAGALLQLDAAQFFAERRRMRSSRSASSWRLSPFKRPLSLR